MASVQIKEETLNRLRKFVVAKYEGKVWGKISEQIEIAINDYLDREEKREKPKVTA
jgi:hypothetical protein